MRLQPFAAPILDVSPVPIAITVRNPPKTSVTSTSSASRVAVTILQIFAPISPPASVPVARTQTALALAALSASVPLQPFATLINKKGTIVI